MTNGKDLPPLQAAQNYSKLRRTQRVHIQMAVLVRGMSKGKPLIGGVKLPGVYLEKLKQARRS